MPLRELSSSDHAELKEGYLSSSLDQLHVVKVSGPKILDYLQGQITQDIRLLSDRRGIYAAVLTPSGKMVSDVYMMMVNGGEVLMFAEKDHAGRLVERLRRFSLGYEAHIGVADDLAVLSVQGHRTDAALSSAELPLPGRDPLATSVDPDRDILVMRVPMAASDGVWLVLPGDQARHWLGKLGHLTDENCMDAARILRGFPRFGIDVAEGSYPLNANFVERQGVSFDKGCYVGQEITSRMRWRGKVRHRLYRVRMTSPPASVPTDVRTRVPVGKISSLTRTPDGHYAGIATLRIETVEQHQSMSAHDGGQVEVMDVIS
jgi:hypothetical protein